MEEHKIGSTLHIINEKAATHCKVYSLYDEQKSIVTVAVVIFWYH